MKKMRIIATVSSLAVAAGVVIATTAGVSAAVGEQLAPVSEPLITQTVGGYEGAWVVENGVLLESFEEDGRVISTGSSGLQAELAADQVTTVGFVAGFGNLETGNDYAQLSGQAGSDVTAVRVVSASGIVTPASLTAGVWGAVWMAGDAVGEYGAATVEFDTAAGTSTVSTDDVDVIAAAQRDAD